MDISPGITALQEAHAEAVLQVGSPDTIQAILDNQVPNGNVFETARVAGLLAAKNTHLSLPHVYPVPIEFARIEFSFADLEIRVLVKIGSVSKSNLEMEAMHAASIVALTIYDMLKVIDSGLRIREIRLLQNGIIHAGQADFKPFDVAVVVCSNAVFKGIKPDSAGQQIVTKLTLLGGKITSYDLIPDEVDQIREFARRLSLQNQLVIFIGGTGLSNTDCTTEALLPLLDTRIRGVEEAMRSYGQKLTPYAMFSRSLAGKIGTCLVLALPGSTRGAKESMDAIFPGVLHSLGSL
jgi:cyclic pyranopterin phosphate synthase